MCESGINIEQLKMSVAQVERSLAQAQQQVEELHQLADRGARHDASASLARVTIMLGEARDKLEDTVEGLEGHTPGPDVTVELL